MAERRPASRAKATKAESPSTPTWADGYEGVNWHLYELVRPHKRHTGATGAGLVEYTLWFEVIRTRPEGDRHDVGIPGQPVR